MTAAAISVRRSPFPPATGTDDEERMMPAVKLAGFELDLLGLDPARDRELGDALQGEVLGQRRHGEIGLEPRQRRAQGEAADPERLAELALSRQGRAGGQLPREDAPPQARGGRVGGRLAGLRRARRHNWYHQYRW